MILSDIILQASNTTSVDALLSQTSGTGITAIVIAIVGIAAAFVEFLRRSGKDKQLDFKDKDLEIKGQDLEKTDQELDGKHNVLQNATTSLVQKRTDLEKKDQDLEKKEQELDGKHRDLEATTQDFKDKSQDRSDGFNLAVENGMKSTKGTDEAVMDHATYLKELLRLLLKDPDLRKIFQTEGKSFMDKIDEDVIHWTKDFKGYYENDEQLPEDDCSDSVIRATTRVRKTLRPHYSLID